MKKPNAPRLVTVAIFTTITVIFWVFLSIWRVLTTKPDPEVSPEILETISPNLDTNALRSLSDRVFFEEGEVQPLQIPSTETTGIEETLTPTPTQIPTITPTVSSSNNENT